MVHRRRANRRRGQRLGCPRLVDRGGSWEDGSSRSILDVESCMKTSRLNIAGMLASRPSNRWIPGKIYSPLCYPKVIESLKWCTRTLIVLITCQWPCTCYWCNTWTSAHLDIQIRYSVKLYVEVVDQIDRFPRWLDLAFEHMPNDINPCIAPNRWMIWGFKISTQVPT